MERFFSIADQFTFGGAARFSTPCRLIKTDQSVHLFALASRCAQIHALACPAPWAAVVNGPRAAWCADARTAQRCPSFTGNGIGGPLPAKPPAGMPAGAGASDRDCRLKATAASGLPDGRPDANLIPCSDGVVRAKLLRGSVRTMCGEFLSRTCGTRRACADTSQGSVCAS